ncbi:group II intron reverse transcriptase/maturase, partial [Paenibacillus sp. N5-1-1-5]|nr:group II intron reverse transcriptase/maturase [Paenibacillus radicis (ex Xue et al. 2023)]
VSDNYGYLWKYYKRVLNLMKKWRNRRSQKKGFTGEKVGMFLLCHPLPLPKIYVNLFASRPVTMK